MGFRPLHDRVLVRRVEAEAKTAGGIIIPDTAQEKPQEGEVVSVGTGARADDGKVTPLDVKAGDKILFGKWSGTEVKIDGEELLIMKETDVMGVIEGVAAPNISRTSASRQGPARQASIDPGSDDKAGAGVDTSSRRLRIRDGACAHQQGGIGRKLTNQFDGIRYRHRYLKDAEACVM